MLSRSPVISFSIFVFVMSISSVEFLSCSGKVSNPCTPQCDGLQCGDDKCGGNCGVCEDPATCQDGQCVSPGECRPPCDAAQCQLCSHGTCENRCFGTEVCNDGMCEEPICDPPCDGNTKICSDSVCKTFAELKNNYIASHPGQAIIPYPWEPITSTRILPFGYEVPAAPGNVVSISACRDEFEAASFVITAQKDLSGITIEVPNLVDAQGNTIPASAIDIRLVKVWYQAEPEDSMSLHYSNATTPVPILTPELLLKDDSLVNVDVVNEVNTLKVTINHVDQYFNISDQDPLATLPPAAELRDATTLQPFSLKATENKQVWITVHVPSDTPTGIYAGNITIKIPSETSMTMNFRVIVLPFNLEPTPLDYGLHYQGDYALGTVGFSTCDRPPANMAIELKNMKDHGVYYPTFFRNRNKPEDIPEITGYLDLRDTLGFPKDKIYTYGWCSPAANNRCPDWTYTGNPTDAEGLALVASKVTELISRIKPRGYSDIYFYGIDEAHDDPNAVPPDNPNELSDERAAWETIHTLGGKIWATGGRSQLIKMVDILDVADIAYGLDAAQAVLWHNQGHRAFSYGNPQGGMENPAIYRKNFGAALWNAGYDGAIDFAYQYKFGGSFWNDFDDALINDLDEEHSYYKDHVLAYPTTNGVIDTIEWEGWREGVDDTRYLATLISRMGNDTLARSIVTDSLSKNESMSTLRKKLIKEILSH
jgi:hypothetical protein